MNWANRLTLSRLGLTILFVFALNPKWQFGRTLALDPVHHRGHHGFLRTAKLRGVMQYVTNFGKLMDPLVDKIMIAAAFISLVPLKAIPAWAATIVVARDFLITGLRLLASAEGQVLPAETLGKHKTSWQIVTVSFSFSCFSRAANLRYADETRYGGIVPGATAGTTLVWITVVLTLYSGLGYAWRHRAISSARATTRREVA